jgi:choline dehydrogenase-like flavoprotein
VLQIAAAHPDRLHVELEALAARIVFDAEGVACGVEYLKGARLYRAHDAPAAVPGERRQVHARREVIVSGGAFNTPQLLMLSGIGPATQLRRHGIPVRIDLAGVGRNLQDRYEVAVTHRMHRPWRALEGARFELGDAVWQRWSRSRSGMYTTSGAAVALIRRSQPGRPEPDIFCMALPARFEGYQRGFSKLISASHDQLTWAVLKGHTQNRAGTVTLRSADPRDPPDVNFRYFEEGDDRTGRDLEAMVEAIRFVRRLTAPLRASGLVAEECAPGPGVESDEDLAAYVRDTAWGHHASCSCPIGPPASGGVLDSAFAVHGARRLRVVDASVFPRIPGFFVAAPVYMIGEKAADAILADAAPPRTASATDTLFTAG